jgi:hypothetical protein
MYLPPKIALREIRKTVSWIKKDTSQNRTQQEKVKSSRKCVYTHTHAHTLMYTCKHVDICTYFTHMQTLHTHAHVLTYTCKHLHICTCTYTHASACKHCTHIHILTHTCNHCTHSYTHTFTHIHMWILSTHACVFTLKCAPAHMYILTCMYTLHACAHRDECEEFFSFNNDCWLVRATIKQCALHWWYGEVKYKW